MNNYKQGALDSVAVAGDEGRRDVDRNILINQAIVYAILYVGDVLSAGQATDAMRAGSKDPRGPRVVDMLKEDV